ncbi:glycosyltransferase family 2 protein [Dehalococcoidia bacterium]|nr:glycosyltransferase family 2 protein [Dehalococcoidia bacterium]
MTMSEAQQTRPKVLAAIPCFNTEPFIADVVSNAKKYVDQVVVINDGSHDGTAEAAMTAGALVISHEGNLGKGAAMKIAAEAASDADVIVFLDGDGQHDPEDIPKVVAPILRGKADIVIGSRHLQESGVSSPSFTRRLTNILASLTISVIISFVLPLAMSLNHLIHPKKSLGNSPHSLATNPTFRILDSGHGTKKWITDCTSGFRAIKKDKWQKLNLISNGFEIETEMIYEAAKNKLTIADAPITCNWNSHISRLSILRDGSKTLKLLAQKLIGDFGGR